MRDFDCPGALGALVLGALLGGACAAPTRRTALETPPTPVDSAAGTDAQTDAQTDAETDACDAGPRATAIEGTRAQSVPSEVSWTLPTQGPTLTVAALDLRVEADGTTLLAVLWRSEGAAGCPSSTPRFDVATRGEVYRWTGQDLALEATLPIACAQSFALHWATGAAGRYLVVDRDSGPGLLLRLSGGGAVEQLALPSVSFQPLAAGTQGGHLALLGAELDEDSVPKSLHVVHLEGAGWVTDARTPMPAVPAVHLTGRGDEKAGNHDLGGQFRGETAVFYWQATRARTFFAGDYDATSASTNLLGSVTARGARFDRPVIRVVNGGREFQVPGVYTRAGKLRVWMLDTEVSEHENGEEDADNRLHLLELDGARWRSVPTGLADVTEQIVRQIDVVETAPPRLVMRSMYTVRVARQRGENWAPEGESMPSGERCCVNQVLSRSVVGPDGALWMAHAIAASNPEWAYDHRLRLLRFSGDGWTPAATLQMPHDGSQPPP